MNFFHLYYFKLVAETKNISKAANLAYISSSGLSKVISRLENEVGYPLFIRENNRIILNDAGRIFLRFAESVLKELDECKYAISTVMEENERIVTIAVPADRLVSPMVEQFLIKHPDARFSQFVMSAEEAITMLGNGGVDFAITHKKIDTPGVVWKELSKSSYCVATGKTHPMALAGVVSGKIADFKNEILHVHGTSSDERDFVLQFCEQAGFVPKLYQSDTFNAISNAIRNMGVLVIPEAFFNFPVDVAMTGSLQDPHDILHQIKLEDENCSITTYIASCEERAITEIVRELYDLIADSFQHSRVGI